MPPSPVRHNTDHDLLIEIRTKLDYLQTEMRDGHTNFIARLERLEREKANYTDLDILRRSIEKTNAEGGIREDLQQAEIDWTKRGLYIAIGAGAMLQFLALAFMQYHR